MKRVSKILSVVLMMAMIFTMNVAVFASSTASTGAKANEVKENDTASLSVKTGNKGDILSAFKVIATGYEKKSNTIKRSFTDDFDSFLKTGAKYKNLNVDEYIALSENELKEILGEFAVYARANSLKPAYTSTTMTEDGKAEFGSVAMGQYIILGSGNSKGAYVYQTVTAEVEPFADGNLYKIFENYTVNMKVSTPYADKKITKGTVKDGAYETAGIGKNVSYKLTATVPQYPVKAANTTLYLKDTLIEGLTLDEDSIVVNAVDGIGNATGLTENTDYKITVSGQTFYVDFIYDSIKNYEKVTVDYNAALNDKANIGTTVGNDNVMTYVYRNSPFDGSTYNPANNDRPTKDTPGYGSDEDKAIIFTYAIAIDKYDREDNTKKLSGAKFELYDNEECKGNPIATVTTDENGIAFIKGLQAGNYYLKEITAPSGYKPLLDAIKVSVNEKTATYSLGENNTKIVTENGKDGYSKVGVENSKVSILPSTGGMGTGIFVVGGIAIMLSATAVFVIKKKISRQ